MSSSPPTPRRPATAVALGGHPLGWWLVVAAPAVTALASPYGADAVAGARATPALLDRADPPAGDAARVSPAVRLDATAPVPRIDARAPAPPVEAGAPAVDANAPAVGAVAPVPRVDADLLDLHSGLVQRFSLPVDGRLAPAEARALGRFLRCRRTGRFRRMHPGLVAMLAAVAAHYPGRAIEVISAFRAPPYEPPSSRHRDGRAIDLRVAGVPTRQLRDFLWATHPRAVGIGYYPDQDFVHMDHRPGERIAWTQPHNNAPYDYQPRWARPTRVATR